MSHTPGPWKVNAHGYDSPYLCKAFIEAEGNGAVAGLWAGDCADAKLIAAAPDLLASLKEVLADASWELERPIIKRAKDAIMKADPTVTFD